MTRTCVGAGAAGVPWGREGAYAIGTAKHELPGSLGVDELIDYRSQDFSGLPRRRCRPGHMAQADLEASGPRSRSMPLAESSDYEHPAEIERGGS